MKVTFQFYKDENGRLRCLCKELGIRKPVETADGSKKYRFAKVMGIPTEEWFGMDIAMRLQMAKDGDIIEAEVV
jgi:hypothetical protein